MRISGKYFSLSVILLYLCSKQSGKYTACKGVLPLFAIENANCLIFFFFLLNQTFL